MKVHIFLSKIVRKVRIWRPPQNCVLFISIMRNKQMMIKILNRQFNTLLNVLNRNDKNIVKCKHIWKCFKYSWSLYFQFRKKSANTVRKMLQKELPTKIRRYETRPAERKMLEMFTYCACVSYLERLKVLWNGNGGRDFSEWVASWLAGRPSWNSRLKARTG